MLTFLPGYVAFGAVRRGHWSRNGDLGGGRYWVGLQCLCNSGAVEANGAQDAVGHK
jgi:hypothetical protein